MADLDELLLAWEEHRDRGEAVSPEVLCAELPHLIQELARRIRRLERCNRLLTAPPASPDEESADGSTAPIPASIAGFEVLGLLGRGGMSVVYQARDPVLQRVVAVKTLRPSSPFVDAGERHRIAERFRREGQVLAGLRHEAIVPVFEARLDRGVPCLVMEYEPGGSLAEQRERLTSAGATAIVPLLERVARAVAHMHGQGVLHRDLKPANLLLDADGQVRVSDFGLAKLIDPIGSEPADSRPGTSASDTGDRAEEVTRLTSPGPQPGTWPYMAPEQFDPARFGPVGPATDIWALGVILYELLTGRRPFSGKTWGEFREAVCDWELPLVPETNRRLKRVVGRCLTRDPGGRFHTAEELADALRASSPRRWWWRGAAAAAVLAGFLAVVAAGLPRTEPERAWPDLPEVTEAQERLARGEAVELIGPGKHPTAFHWATGPASGRVISAPGEPFRVVSMSPVGCLVELLPDLPPGRYRVEAELLHDTGNGMNSVGLYAAGSHCEIDRGRQHFLLMAQYSDWGWIGQESSEANTVTANRRTYLAARYFGDSNRGLMAGMEYPTSHPRGQLVPAPAVGPRRVSLTIDRNGVSAEQDETNVGYLSRDEAARNFDDARRQYPDLPVEGWTVRTHGGIGLYLYSAALTVNYFRVVPLPRGE